MILAGRPIKAHNQSAAPFVRLAWPPLVHAARISRRLVKSATPIKRWRGFLKTYRDVSLLSDRLAR